MVIAIMTIFYFCIWLSMLNALYIIKKKCEDFQTELCNPALFAVDKGFSIVFKERDMLY